MRMEVTSENGEKCEEGTQVYLGDGKEKKKKDIVGYKIPVRKNWVIIEGILLYP